MPEQLPDHVDQLLAGLAEGAARTARAQGPEAARRRGRKRTMRRRIALSALSLAVLVGGIGTAFAVTGGSGQSPAVVAPSSSSPVPVLVPSASAPAPSASTSASTEGTPAAAPVLALKLPSQLAQGTSNQVGFTVANPGPARTVDVLLDLGNPASAHPGSTAPDERARAVRLDPATGTPRDLPVSYTSGVGGFTDTAAYRLALPADGSVTERLFVVPAGSKTVTFGVRLSPPGGPAVVRTRTLPLVDPSLTATGPASVTTGTTSGTFTFTLDNTTGAAYDGIQLRSEAGGSTPDCDFTPFQTFSWSEDGGPWRTASLGSGQPLLDTVQLAAGQRLVVRLRLTVPGNPASCLGKGFVSLNAASADGEIGAANTAAAPGDTGAPPGCPGAHLRRPPWLTMHAGPPRPGPGRWERPAPTAPGPGATVPDVASPRRTQPTGNRRVSAAAPWRRARRWSRPDGLPTSPPG
ncbi:hypothetical protein [Streptacidiphilus sp. PAMC 29251]